MSGVGEVGQDRLDRLPETLHVRTRRKFQVNVPNVPVGHVSAGQDAPNQMQVCAYCDAPADTVDHVVPRAFGGTEDPANKTPACRSCNSSKGTMPAELFRADWRTIRDYLIERGWAPVVPGRVGKNSSWRSPDPALRNAFFTRTAAIRAAAYGVHHWFPDV